VRASRTLTTPALFDLEEEHEEPAAAPGLYARVAIQRPIRREFTYVVPDELAARVLPGVRVAVVFARRRHVAVVVALETTSDVPARKLQPVLEVLDAEPVVGAELLGLTRWMADRYASSWGEALAAVLPAPLKRERKSRRIAVVRAAEGVGEAELGEIAERFPKQHRLLRFLIELSEPIELREVLRRTKLSESPARTLERRGWVRIERVDPPDDDLQARASARPRPEHLSDAQQAAVTALRASLDAREHRTFLLAGVTGSGKTEVYLRAIEAALEAGRTAIVLVPEIALTPQTVGWFRSRFGEVCVLHSGMTDAQRLASWRRLRHGEVRVVVGARSALFAPVEDLGVVVVDEEHEPSFKQESVPRYHARDVAIERARRAGAVCILGSATPSLESWTRGRDGTYELLRLPERVGGGAPPTVHVVDMRTETRRGRGGPAGQKGAPLFSHLLQTLLTETLAAREQAILFLNRRGFVPVLWCPGCEESVSCDQCDVGLTYHRRIERLVCHSCCEERALPPACPTCTRPGLRFLGMGSERVETELARLFPDARVRRMDSDTMRRRGDYEEVLGAFERHEVDVLVGTQMIAKGLDFPRVTLVGIVSADPALHLPDFRAAERTFQLIAQVAGRAGRSELPGRIVVQTMAPEHPAIRHGATADHETFVREEAALRAELGYPPSGRLLRVVFEDTDEKRMETCAEELAEALRAEPAAARTRILGPAPAPFALLRGRHRRHVLVKAALDDPDFERVVDWLADRAAKESRTTVKIDVDPMSLL
jgi:primosomal protein N' (replication factor Y)